MISGRQANVLLFAVTVVELSILLQQTATFAAEDWIYLSQHILVLGISLARRDPVVVDQSWPTATAVIVSYAYPYAQVAYLNWSDGHVAWSDGGVALVVVSALLSLVALLSIGRLFGVRPALRGIATIGPYRLVRHPMYLAYVIGDIGYLLEEWNIGLLLIVAAGWASLAYRIYAEERVLSAHPDWSAYIGRTPYRLVPGVW
ncbi:MAG TPA: isoprenylcysteine carboxylmethyltransferase family protein [Caulobacteraceae bacterium]|nr:isoprenylcysteine carboxylmethyltransferase family protein [Caulobacteraceae bacterium]